MKLAIISGGTATNSLVNLYSSLSTEITYILPISDNGGSTSELIRVAGGPAIGDLRSRVSRLIPEEQSAMKELFSHRLPDDINAKVEWNRIVDGSHPLWNNIESHIKELIRPFFIEINSELLKRSRPGREFQFEKASIGNLFLTGARLFFGSIESAIELLLRLSHVSPTISVLPVLNTNFSHHISALLKDGTVITGQSQISHPSSKSIDSTMDIGTRLGTPRIDTGTPMSPDNEDAHYPFTHPDLKLSQLRFSKVTNEPLPSPIDRIYYINPYGQEIHPRASNRVINSITSSDAVIFSIGSLYTSTIPVVILQGVSQAIQACRKRVMLLNGESDRETIGMDALAHVQAITDACKVQHSNSVVTHLVYLEDGGIPVQESVLEALGIRCIPVEGSGNRYNESALFHALKNILES